LLKRIFAPRKVHSWYTFRPCLKPIRDHCVFLRIHSFARSSYEKHRCSYGVSVRVDFIYTFLRSASILKAPSRDIVAGATATDHYMFRFAQCSISDYASTRNFRLHASIKLKFATVIGPITFYNYSKFGLDRFRNAEVISSDISSLGFIFSFFSFSFFFSFFFSHS